MKFMSLAVLLASGLAASSVIGCSSPDATLTYDEALSTETGSVKLSLTVGDRTINSVTAVISGKHGFVTQTHTIDVTGDSGVVSIFFGNLPVGHGYKIELTAGDCSGSAGFRVDAGQTTLVPVTVTCEGGDGEPKETGSVQVTGTIVGGGSSPACDHVTKIVAAPSVQNGSGPNAEIELFLDNGVTPTTIAWSSSSTTGATGTIGALSGTTDREVTFDCSTNGTIFVIADVTAAEGSRSCTEQARVTIECVNQGTVTPVCGDGIVNGTEQCDGAAGLGTCPAGTTGSVTCTSQCTRNTTACVAAGPVCGDGIVNGAEQCDGSAGLGTCPAGTTGSVTCTAQCTRNTTACVAAGPVCGDGIVNGAEQCDGSAGLGTCPAGTTGSVSCTSQCALDTSACVGAGPGECGQCALDNCAPQRADVDSNLSTVAPIIDCVLGDNWEAGNRASETSCANGDLLTCYCGSVAGQDCANAAPGALDGQCVPEVLAGTGCTTSSCVAPIFLNPANSNGKAMQYIQCQQDFCFDSCFN